MTTLDERMTAFERLSLASKLDLLAREVFSQKYGDVFYPPCKWDFNNIQNFGGFPQPGFEDPVKVEKSEWILNKGGGCPVPKGTLIEVQYRDEVIQVCAAMESDNKFGERCATRWELYGHYCDIVGYRLVPEEELHLYRKPEEEPVTMTVKESNESLKLKHDEKESAKDAARYRWLREQHWSGGVIAVVLEPKIAVRLGEVCPSGVELDRIIDDKMGG